jgi:hypothetical protein
VAPRLKSGQELGVQAQAVDRLLSFVIGWSGSMAQEQRDYTSYLLRLWRSGKDEKSVWRASLQSTHNGPRLNFPDLESLVEFLKVRYGSSQMDPVYSDESNARDERRNEQSQLHS